jgi:opine dehydrogenase
MTTESGTRPRIAVLGGGNGAHALAATAVLAGVSVHMYEDPEFAASFAPTRERRTIELIEPGGRARARLACATHDLDEALAGVTYVHVATNTAGHAPVFARLVLQLRSEQTVVVWAGRFGGLRLARALRVAGRGDGIIVAETNTLPFGTRLTGPAEVTVFYQARRIFVGTLPTRAAHTVVDAIRPWCPIARAAPDILSAAFRNGAIVVYPVGALFNAGRIEHARGEFNMFREGITPAVARVIQALYGELERVGEAFGLDVEHYPESAFAAPHTIEKEEFTDPAGSSAPLNDLTGPTAIPTRYLFENLRNALPVVAELGRVAGVATPGIDALIHLGGLLSGDDFWAERQGLATLGLDGLDLARIRARLRE